MFHSFENNGKESGRLLAQMEDAFPKKGARYA